MEQSSQPFGLRLSEGLGPTSPEREAVADLVSVLCDPEGKAAIRGSDGDLAIIDAALTTLRVAMDDCEQYLKEGETLAQRIERERRDTGSVLKLLAREKQKNEQLNAEYEDLKRCHGDNVRNLVRDADKLRDVLHRMLEAPTTHVGESWKVAIRAALVGACPSGKCSDPARDCYGSGCLGPNVRANREPTA